MKQKVLIISLLLVIGLILSSLLSITSLSFTKQIKSTFSKFDNTELLEGYAKPPSGEMTVLEDKEGIDEGIPVLMFFKEKIAPFVSSDPGNINKMAAYYSPIFILLLMFTYFLAKHYKKKRKRKRKRKSNNSYEIEEVHIHPIVQKRAEIERTSFTKEKRVATPIQIHETRKLLQKWEAGLVGKRMKKEAETINEWFARINGPVEIIPIYEKVRYGEQSCTEGEVNFIKNTLKL